MADEPAVTELKLDTIMQALAGSQLSLMRNHGTGMGTALDPFTQVEIGYGRLLSEFQLRSLFRGSWFIRRVVEVPADDMTKAGVELTLHDETSGDISTAALQVYRDGGQNVSPYSTRMSCGEAFRKAMTWGRWFGQAYAVMRVNGGEDPSKPLRKVRSFEGLSVLDRYAMRPDVGTLNPEHPEFYRIDRLDNTKGAKQAYKVGQRIHESRVLVFKGATIHPYDIQLEGDGAYDSVIQQIYEVFTRHYMAKDAISKGLDSYSLFKVAIGGLANLLSGDGGTDTLKAYLNTVAQQMSLHRIIVQDTEASKSEFQERTFAGVEGLFAQMAEELTAAANLPHYKIWGSVGKSGLSDSGGAESRAWAEQVQAMQRREFGDNHRRLFHAIFEALGEVPESWEVEYPSIYTPTPEEEGAIAKTHAETLTLLTREGVITTRQAYQALATGQPLENVLEPLDDSDVLTIVDEAEAEGPSAEDELAALLGGGTAPAGGEAAIDPAANPEPEEVQGPEESIEAEGDEEELFAADAADTYTPPAAARSNAQQVLDWLEEHGDEVKGMTEVGWGRARQLASGDPISLDTVKRIAQFNRHRQNYEKARAKQKAEGGNPWEYAGIVAWLGWGGSTAVDWAIGISGRADAATYSKGDPVAWTWGEGTATGTVAQVFTDRVQRTIEGAEITRNGTPENPALLIEQENGARALKLASEVRRNDDDTDPADLVLLAVKAIYEQSNWTVIGIRNLLIVEGGLSVEVAVENNDTGDRVLVQGQYNESTGTYNDRLLAESKADSTWRMDAPRKKSAGAGSAPKCKKGRPCGRSCIAANRNCKVNTQGVVNQALNQAVATGAGGAGGSGGGQPVAPPQLTPVQAIRAALASGDINEVVRQSNQIYLDAQKLAPDRSTFYQGIAAGNATPDDWILKRLNQITGYDGKPQQVTKGAIDAAYNNGQHVAYRAMSRTPASFNKRFDDFKNGDFYAGHGIYGHGTYVAYAVQGGMWGKGVAHKAAAPYGSGMMRLALAPDANIVKANDLTYEVRKVDQDLKNWYRQTGDKDGYRRARSVLIGDEGEGVSARLATIKGYDAITLTGVAYDDTYMTLLNRAKTLVQKTKGSKTQP